MHRFNPEHERTKELSNQGVDGIVALKNLAPTPSAICNMGLLMCIAANARDFPLHAGCIVTAHESMLCLSHGSLQLEKMQGSEDDEVLGLLILRTIDSRKATKAAVR